MQLELLLVEDDPLVRQSVGVMARRLGCTVVDASDAETALELLRRLPPETVVISDVVLTGPMRLF